MTTASNSLFQPIKKYKKSSTNCKILDFQNLSKIKELFLKNNAIRNKIWNVLSKSIENQQMLIRKKDSHKQSREKFQKVIVRSMNLSSSTSKLNEFKSKLCKSNQILKTYKEKYHTKPLQNHKIRKDNLNHESFLLGNMIVVKQIESFIIEDSPQKVQEQKNQIILNEFMAAPLTVSVCLYNKFHNFQVIRYLDQKKSEKAYLTQQLINQLRETHTKTINSIKMIYRSSLDENKINQLIREVKIQGFLDHPCIIKLYHFFADRQNVYLILQPCLGENLYQKLKVQQKMPEKKVKQIIKEVCTAVEYMHKNNIIHRDIKLQNILVHQNMVKLCNFRSAIHLPLLEDAQCQTSIQTQVYDSRIDIQSIGILTYQLLYGRIPFQIRHLNNFIQIIQQEVYLSKEILISDAAKDFIANCMKKNSAHKYNIRQLLEHEFLNKNYKFRWTIW